MNLGSLKRFAMSGVISSDIMRAVDKNADAYIPASQRMEAAGTVFAAEIRAEHADRVLFVCGAGNNGGDGLCAARHLAREMDVSVYLPILPKTKDAAAQLKALDGTDVKILSSLPSPPDIIADCMFGTGARSPLAEPFFSVAKWINSSGSRVISCDMPSPGVHADKVVAFHLAKTPGASVQNIGIPLAAEIFCGDGDLLLVPQKSPSAHKGEGGSVLIVGGGPYQGAPFLAGMAALRGGADIVRVATPADGFAPDIIVEKLAGNKIGDEHRDRLFSLAEKSDVVVAGPGLGTAPESLSAACDTVSFAKRAVVDADLLRNPLPLAREATLYTPHAGEFARCFGKVPSDLAERGDVVKAAACDAVILLKGKEDVISDGKRVKFNLSGSPSMTVGGTGDVLSGLCGGLLCRMKPFEAACAAAYSAGKAGELAGEKTGDGLIASDILPAIAHVLWQT